MITIDRVMSCMKFELIMPWGDAYYTNFDKELNYQKEKKIGSIQVQEINNRYFSKRKEIINRKILS